MIPLHLKLYNFMSYKNPASLDFSVFDLACLTGPNGSGKSTILDAITWALWEKSRAPSSDDLIHHGQLGMWVEFEFELDGKEYKIIRKREKKGRGQSELSFFIKEKLGWASLTETTKTETEQRIEKVLHLPYEIFETSAYLRQGHADEFANKTPSERKEILGKILGLDLYENLSTSARAKSREIEIEEDALISQIKEVALILEEKPKILKEYEKTLFFVQKTKENLKKEEEKLKILEKERQKIELLTASLENLKNREEEITQEGQSMKLEVKRYEEEINVFKKIRGKEKEIEKHWQEFKNLAKENERLNQKLGELSEIQKEEAVLKHKEESLILKVKEVKEKGKCPTCLRPMKKEEAKSIIEHLKKEFAEKEGPRLKELSKKIKEIGYEKEEHQKIKRQLKDLANVEEEKRELEAALVTYKEKQEYLNKIKEKLGQKRKQYLETKKQEMETESKLKKQKPAGEKWQEAQDKVEQLRLDFGQIQESLGVLKQKVNYIKEQEKLYQERRERLKEIGEEKDLYKELSEIFSKKGIQARILETAIPEIENEANRILSKITDGRMNLRFETQKEKKIGEEIIETLEIKVADEIGERDRQLYSGGEGFKIDLVTRLALSKVLSRRAGAKLQFLIIDEGFGSLDTTSRDIVVQAINGIKGEFKKILVVTHLEDLKNLFPTRIEVNKDEEGSHLEMVSV